MVLGISPKRQDYISVPNHSVFFGLQEVDRTFDSHPRPARRHLDCMFARAYSLQRCAYATSSPEQTTPPEAFEQPIEASSSESLCETIDQPFYGDRAVFRVRETKRGILLEERRPKPDLFALSALRLYDSAWEICIA